MHSVSASLPSSTDVSQVPTPLVKRDQDCRTADVGTGMPCGETNGLRILDEFRKLYESRIEKIDRESGDESDRISVSSCFIISLYLSSCRISFNSVCTFDAIFNSLAYCNLIINVSFIFHADEITSDERLD